MNKTSTPGCRGAFQMVDREQRERERGRKKSEREGYGNIHSLQRSPKMGIEDRADALSAPPERGWRAYSLNSLTIYQRYKKMEMCF